MDYDQFFPKQDTKCDCSDQIRVTVFLIGLVVVLVDSIAECGRARKLKKLENENETLKSVLLKTVDRILIRMMKNGIPSDDDHTD
jgi:hypothetical protein